jgi:hypothetical protein
MTAGKLDSLANGENSEILGFLPLFSTIVELQADRCFELLEDEPLHPSLHFMKNGR